MKNTEYGFYRAFIAANEHSPAFEFCESTKSREAAVAAVKRRNSPYWRDYFIWSVYFRPNGIDHRSYKIHR